MNLSIDLGSRYIHILAGNKTASTTDIKHVIEIECSEGCFNAQGQVNVEAVAPVIRKALRENKIKVSGVSITLQSPYLITTEVSLPLLKKSELRIALEQEIAKYADAEKQYSIIHNIIEEEDRTNTYRVRALPNEIIESCIYLVKKIGGLQLKALNTHDYYMQQKIESSRSNENVVIADIGSNFIQLYLVEKGKLIFTQHAFINTVRSEKAFEKQAGTGEGSFRNIDLSKETITNDIYLKQSLEGYMKSICTQIESMIYYQVNRNASEPVSKVYIMGGVSNIKGVSEYIREELGLPVDLVNFLFADDKYLYENTTVFSNAFNALAIPKTTSDNDFLKSYKREAYFGKGVSKVTIIGASCFAILVIVTCASASTNMVRRVQMRSEINRINIFLEDEQIQQEIAALQQLQQLTSGLQDQVNVLEGTVNIANTYPKMNTEYFKSLTKELPADTKLTDVSYSTGIINLSIEAGSEASIIKYVQYLRSMPTSEDVTYTGFVNEEGKYQYNIQISVIGGDADEES